MPLHPLDRWLMDNVESSARTLERTLGVHPFTVAAYGILVSVASFMVWTFTRPNVEPIFVLLVPLILLPALLNLYLTPNFIREARRASERGHMNPLKLDPVFATGRILVTILLLLSVTLLLVFIDYGGFVEPVSVFFGMFLYLYFRSCDGLPPWVRRSPVGALVW